ncbi:hypothetical protein ACFL59_02220 [Planctomycetota bacterium]
MFCGTRLERCVDRRRGLDRKLGEVVRTPSQFWVKCSVRGALPPEHEAISRVVGPVLSCPVLCRLVCSLRISNSASCKPSEEVESGKTEALGADLTESENLKGQFRDRAARYLSNLTTADREAMLVRCWMSHDAHWFMAAAMENSLDAVNRWNQQAAREVGKAEARRIARAVGLPELRTVDDCLLAQEVIVSLVGPDLIDYRLHKLDERSYEVQVVRCFASQRVARVGILEQYKCGIFARVGAWLETLGVDFELSPALGPCMKKDDGECRYVFTLTPRAP